MHVVHACIHTYIQAGRQANINVSISPFKPLRILVLKQENRKHYYNSYLLLSTYLVSGTFHMSVLIIKVTLEVGITSLLLRKH